MKNVKEGTGADHNQVDNGEVQSSTADETKKRKQKSLVNPGDPFMLLCCSSAPPSPIKLCQILSGPHITNIYILPRSLLQVIA